MRRVALPLQPGDVSIPVDMPSVHITDVAMLYKFASVNYVLTYPGVSLPSDAGYKRSRLYNAREGICELSSSNGVTGDKDGSNASGLMSAINQQSLSLTIQAVQAIFQNTGTVTSCCGNSPAHGVLAAGYDSAAGFPVQSTAMKLIASLA